MPSEAGELTSGNTTIVTWESLVNLIESSEMRFF